MERNVGHALRIEQSSINPRDTRIWLDGIELWWQDLTLYINPNDLTTATITLGLSKVEADAQTLINLKAICERSYVPGETD